MNKATTMTFRVEPELHANFLAAAELAHQPASQILRDFMRHYVQSQKPPKPAITDAERQRRTDAVAYARASIGLEEFQVSEETEREIARYVNGDIELSGILAKLAHDAER